MRSELASADDPHWSQLTMAQQLIGAWALKHLLPKHADNPSVPYEPPASFLIGKWADLALCFVVALILPVARNILRSAVYEVLQLTTCCMATMS